MPRIAALLMLRSTISTVSAPATCLFRGSITNPTQSLCTLRGRRCRRLTQHLLPGGLLGPYPGRTFTGWTAPALAGAFAGSCHLRTHAAQQKGAVIRSPHRGGRGTRPARLGSLWIDDKLTLVSVCTGKSARLSTLPRPASTRKQWAIGSGPVSRQLVDLR